MRRVVQEEAMLLHPKLENDHFQGNIKTREVDEKGMSCFKFWNDQYWYLHFFFQTVLIFTLLYIKEKRFLEKAMIRQERVRAVSCGIAHFTSDTYMQTLSTPVE